MRRLTLTFIAALLLVTGYAAGRADLRLDSVTAQSDCQTFTETGKTVCAEFLTYWKANGGLAQQGFPISDTFNEMSETDGKTYKVQYFERAVFEAHPEKQPPYNVLLTLLGSQKFKQRYNNTQPSGTVSAAMVAATAVPATASATVTPTTPSPTTTRPAAAMSGSVQRFSGTGTKVTQRFSLVAGLVAFKSVSQAGRDNFIAHLVDPSGNELALAANEIGPSTSSTVANVKEGGMYALAVQYDGTWTIEVSNPGSTLDNPIKVPTTFTGTGRMVTQPFTLSQGSLTVNYVSMTGRDNFIAHLVDSSGLDVGLGANEIGPSNGSRIVRVPANGVYVFEVQYDGKWSLSVTQG